MDLAGSERTDDGKMVTPPLSKEKLAELTSINNSLLILGQCISALGNAKNTHIPYRRSKLTRILKNSLCGDSKVLLIACISPSVTFAQETFQTLQFAKTAIRAKLGEFSSRAKSGYSELSITKSSLDKLREAYEKEKSRREHLETFISENNLEGLKAELEEVKKQNVDLSVKMLGLGTEPKKHVRFKSRVENEDSLDSEQKERMEHNLKYRDDTIFENISIFREVQDAKLPYEKYFHEPALAVTTLLEPAEKIHESESSSSSEFEPKGKFALLNNSLTVQHEKMLAIVKNKHTGEKDAVAAGEKKAPAVAAGTALKTAIMHIEESAIAPNGEDTNSFVAYESLKNDLEHLATSQQQSSMGDLDEKNAVPTAAAVSKTKESEISSSVVVVMYQKILAEISGLKQLITESRVVSNPTPEKVDSKSRGREMLETLRKELYAWEDSAKTGTKSTNFVKVTEIVNQMQNIFDNV